MIDSNAIYKQATELVKQCGTRSPEKIARELDIMLLLLENTPNLLGMYTFRWNHRIILMNQRLQAYMRQMVLAHELGHSLKNTRLSCNTYQLSSFLLKILLAGNLTAVSLETIWKN